MTNLQIQVLGDFRLLADGVPVTTLNTPRLQALLTYLVLHRDAPQSRRQLAFNLWPDSSETQARTNLRNLLHLFRRALPGADQFLLSDRHTIQWNLGSSFSFDVAAFEAARKEAETRADLGGEQAALQNAVDLYRGELLPGCYQDWIYPERERLREAYLAALEKLVQLAETRRQYPLAITNARRILRHDPLHEATYRRLMRLHALNQDTAGALRTYHACASVLKRELDVAPSPETQADYERLLNLESQPQPAPLATRTPLVGRRDAWEVLLRLWRKAATGQAHLGLLTGEAGIGKTRLAEELIDWGTRQGFTILTSRCYAAEGRLAYAPLADWLRTLAERGAFATLDPIWLGELSRLLPDLANRYPELTPPIPLAETWQRQRLHEALAHGILAAPQPFVLFIDNLQWADSETLAWLHFLLRFDDQARFLILGTVREEETAPDDSLKALRLELHHQGLLTEIPLRRLNEADTEQLARQVAGQALDAAQRTRLFQETEGNPLFVMELVRSGNLETGGLTPRLQAVIERRLGLLSPEARELAGLAATIGRAFTFDVLAQASSFQEEALVRALDELWSRRVVLEQGVDAYDFSHERLREVAYQSLSAARRRLNHRRTAAALAARHQGDLDPVSGQIASHYAAASQWPEVVTFSRRAAEAARRLYAHQEAIDHYNRILEVLTRHPGAQGENQDLEGVLSRTHENLGEVQALVGQIETALAHYQQALDLTADQDPLRRAHLESQLGATRHTAHQFEAARLHLQRAGAILDSVEAKSPGWWQVHLQVLQARGWTYYRLTDLEALQSLIDTLEPLIEKHGTPSQRAEFYGFLVGASNLRNRFVVAGEDIKSAEARLAAAQELNSETAVGQARFSLGFELLWFGELEKAEEQLQLALGSFERIGYRLMESRCLTYLATLYRLEGDLERTAEANHRNLKILQNLSTPDYLGMARAHEAWLAWRRKDLDLAEAHSHAALDSWQEAPNYPFQWAGLWPALAVAKVRVNLAAAADHARALLAEKQQQLPAPFPELLDAFLQAHQQGDEAAAKAHLARALPLARDRGYL